MYNMIDVVKNIDTVYQSNTAFQVLKDFERVIDELDVYVYDNWKDGELVIGPKMERHWVTCTFMWERENMPDPMGGKRLLDYDCKVSFKKDHYVEPKKIEKPDDLRPGTKKGKLERRPIWLVEIQMPKKLIFDIYSGSFNDVETNTEMSIPANADAQTADAAAAAEPEEGAVV